MDWSAIFAGIAAVTSILGLVYSVRQHRDNIRTEFIRWALENINSHEQREGRGILFVLNSQENKGKKQFLIDGVVQGAPKVLYGKTYNSIRTVFALFNEIGYFWLRRGYGHKEDALSLFPQVSAMWETGEPIIKAIRTRRGQSTSFAYFEEFAKEIERLKNREKSRRRG